MSVGPHQSIPTPAPGQTALQRGHWIAIGVLAVVEIASALYLAQINPVQGYDENWYLINAYRFQGVTTLPYVANRPPMLPMLLALLGDHYRILSGLAHIAATGVIFAIFRRLVSPWTAIAGTAVFMVCGDIRLYNMLQLTEMPAILFLLLVVYLFLANRPFLLGATCTVLVMTHWSMATVPPVIVLAYAMQRRWLACAVVCAGGALAAAPFLVAFTFAFGNPVGPFITHLGVQQSRANDWLYYLREFPQLPVALIAGGLAAFGWLVVKWRVRGTQAWYACCALLLALVVVRLALVNAIAAKAERYLVPLVPMLLLLTVLMLAYYGSRLGRARWALWGVVLVSVLPSQTLYWRVHDLLIDPVNALPGFDQPIAGLAPNETIYTDFNDLALMARTGHPVVAVVSDLSWHHRLYSRPRCAREEIPDRAAYLTWEPEGTDALTGGVPTHKGKLWLVRWRAKALDSIASALPAAGGR